MFIDNLCYFRFPPLLSMRGARMDDPVNISSDESVDSSSAEASDTSSDEHVDTSYGEDADTLRSRNEPRV